ncbi:NAD(P)H-binding protein, partial [Mesorhizobium sp. M00.F.Ca.ET.220.01.1.1]
MTGTVAVLGANGFIGCRTVELLQLSGWANVRPIVRRPDAFASLSRFAIDAMVADARDIQALTAAFAGCKYVVHAVAGDARTIVDAIEPVYRAAAAAGVLRLIYLSSASVHGQSPPPGTDETSA